MIIEDCGWCRYCLDMPKFGGKYTLKQCCVQRDCKRLKDDVDSCPEIKTNGTIRCTSIQQTPKQ